MASKTSDIIKAFVNSIDNNQEYSIKQFNKLLTAAYNKNHPKKLSEFNIFMQEQIALQKQNNPNLKANELMRLAAAEWSKKKLVAKVNEVDEVGEVNEVGEAQCPTTPVTPVAPVACNDEKQDVVPPGAPVKKPMKRAAKKKISCDTP